MFPTIPCKRLLGISLTALLYATSAMSLARLPAPTPEQEKVAADKKANAAAEAEAEKQRLAATMERIAARWRARANESGWPAYQPTPVTATAGFDASAAQSSASGQPGGRRGSAAMQAPVRSEKSGTAPASEDVKKAAPAGTAQ